MDDLFFQSLIPLSSTLNTASATQDEHSSGCGDLHQHHQQQQWALLWYRYISIPDDVHTDDVHRRKQKGNNKNGTSNKKGGDRTATKRHRNNGHLQHGGDDDNGHSSHDRSGKDGDNGSSSLLLPTNNCFIKVRRQERSDNGQRPEPDFKNETIEEVSTLTRQQLQKRQRERIRRINEKITQQRSHGRDSRTDNTERCDDDEKNTEEGGIITYGRLRIARDGVNGILVGSKAALEEWVAGFEFDGPNTDNNDEVMNEGVNQQRGCSSSGLAEEATTKEQIKSKQVHWKWSPFNVAMPTTTPRTAKNNDEVVSSVSATKGRPVDETKKKSSTADNGNIQIRLCEEVVSLFGNCYNYTAKKKAPVPAAAAAAAAETTGGPALDDEAVLFDTIRFYKERMERQQQQQQQQHASSNPPVDGTSNSHHHHHRRVIAGDVPSRYLDAQQWHQALLGLGGSQKPHGPEGECESESSSTQKSVAASGGAPRDVVLFDVRNIYETNIGAFAPPPPSSDAKADTSDANGNGDTTTGARSSSSRTIEHLRIPPTRQCSDLPRLLVANREQIREQCKGKDVMMYCTGGVRCERTSKLMKLILTEEPESEPASHCATTALSDDDKGRQSSEEAPQHHLNNSAATTNTDTANTNIYQLFGGIESYLSHVPPEEGLFKGRNFVFDPRMDHGYLYEHFHHQKNNTNAESETSSTSQSTQVSTTSDARRNAVEGPISKCVACGVTPWGDYTSAHARCSACAIRVLVCAPCVEKYQKNPPPPPTAEDDDGPRLHRVGDHVTKVPHLRLLCDICRQGKSLS